MYMDFFFQDGQKSFYLGALFYAFIPKQSFKDRSQSVLVVSTFGIGYLFEV